MDYTQLDMKHKRAFLMNLRALSMCTNALATLTEESVISISESLLDESSETIDKLTDVEVNGYIKKIEHHHREYGGVLRQKKEKCTD
ncbi:MAG TPA: hypothetical protein DEV81_07045 [Cyanobacteria bacterium UBA11049]|nr:hypothetical protein [Cyanobacteria bacterium UBA11049]